MTLNNDVLVSLILFLTSNIPSLFNMPSPLSNISFFLFYSTQIYLQSLQSLYYVAFSKENQPTKTSLHQRNHTTNKQITPRHHEVRPLGPGSLGVLSLLGATSFAPSLESAALVLSKVGDMGGTG